MKLFKRKKTVDTAMILVVENIEPGHQHVSMGSRVGKSEVIEYGTCTAKLTATEAYFMIEKLETTGRKIAEQGDVEFYSTFYTVQFCHMVELHFGWCSALAHDVDFIHLISRFVFDESEDDPSNNRRNA